MKTYIVVKNQFDALHCWPNAPDEVKYLRDLHRHTFYIETKIEVYGLDRSLEFYMVKDKIQELIDSWGKLPKSSKSCEMIATDIIDFVRRVYGNERFISCEVSEDMQNSAIVEYEPKIRPAEGHNV